MKKIKQETAKPVAEYYAEHGRDATAKKFNISPESVRRYVREYKSGVTPNPFDDKPQILKRIAERYTPSELRAMADGGALGKPHEHAHKIDFSGSSFRFLFMTDTHIGSTFFRPDLFFAALEEGRRQKIDAVFHAGDVTEGMSGRPGQIYELTHLGASRQRDYAVELFQNIDVPLYMIDGNHDRWVAKASGTLIVKDICDRLPQAHFLGHDQGVIPIKKASILLWHGEDSSSYATSYRVQKLIEAFTGGEKPSVLLCGHTHKQGFFFDRNVHAITGGALSLQSSWMKGKRLANHTGFHIVTLHINKDGQVSRCQVEWFPGYV